MGEIDGRGNGDSAALQRTPHRGRGGDGETSQITAVLDARVGAELAAMDVLATAGPVKGDDLSAAAARIQEVASFRTAWRDVILTNAIDGTIIYSLSGRTGALEPTPTATAGAAAGGVSRSGETCPCVYLHTPVQARST